jgi:ankyrin repeat protein
MADRPDDRTARAAARAAHSVRDEDDDDGHDDGAPPPIRPAPPVSVYGLEAGLLFDAARLVALNGYAHECRLLPFLSPDYHREEDFLIATKHVRYGPMKRTRLMSLARKGDEVRVRRLMRVGADVLAKDQWNQTVLELACEGGLDAVVKDVLKDKADELEDSMDEEDFQSYMVKLLFAAAMGGCEAIVKLLLERDDAMGVDEIDYGVWDGSTLLQVASEFGREGVVRLLASKGAILGITNLSGKSALHLAADYNHLGIVAALVDAGDDIDAVVEKDPRDVDPDDPWDTALNQAAECGRATAVRRLLELGACVNGPEDTSSRDTPLFRAIDWGHAAVARILLDKGADVDGPGDYSPFSHAIDRGLTAVVRILLDKGADVDGPGDYSPLLEAVWRGHTETVQLLIDRGADVNAVLEDGRSTPLHEACEGGREAIMRALVAAGADVNATDAQGSTPLGRVPAGKDREAFVRAFREAVAARERDEEAGAEAEAEREEEAGEGEGEGEEAGAGEGEVEAGEEAKVEPPGADMDGAGDEGRGGQ